jgi:hypothetical protein
MRELLDVQRDHPVPDDVAQLVAAASEQTQRIPGPLRKVPKDPVPGWHGCECRAIDHGSTVRISGRVGKTSSRGLPPFT